MHPLSGPDHLLVMVAVGLWAAQMRGRALWLVPATFLTMMVVGGALAIAGADLPEVETTIAVSAFTLGVFVASAWQAPLAPALSLAGLFALFHGFAHATEIPAAAQPELYALGLILASASLHAVGIVTTSIATRPLGHRLVRTGGAVMAIAAVAANIGR